jgi:hypothetical protein
MQNIKAIFIIIVASLMVVSCGSSPSTGTTGTTGTTSNVGAGVTAVVSGAAGSIAFHYGTKVTDISPTQYSLPMSVQVVDIYGVAINNAKVTLTAWPTFYKFGIWVPRDFGKPNIDCVVRPYLAGGSFAVPNEDVNKNLILDPTENLPQTVSTFAGYDAYGNVIAGPAFPVPADDGILTPYSATAGTFVQDASLQPISSVTTDVSGTANFSLLYLKGFAPWVVTQLKATTTVIGTEKTAILEFPLLVLNSEVANCALRNSFGGSPFNDPRW